MGKNEGAETELDESVDEGTGDEGVDEGGESLDELLGLGGDGEEGDDEGEEGAGDEGEEGDEGDGEELSTAEIMAKLSPEARALAKRLQGDYTRKTQALARERAKLAAEREALRAEADAQLLELPKRKAERIDPKTLDPLDPAQLAAFIEQQVQDRLDAERAPVVASARQRAAQLAVEKFKADHDDFADHEDTIADLLTKDENLSLEAAYWIAVGRASRPARGAKQGASPARRAAARQLGGGVPSDREIPAHIRNHPDPGVLFRWLERRG